MKRFEQQPPAPGTCKRATRLRASMTHAEKVLAKALRQEGLRVRRQALIGKYVADFAFHSVGLILELDGPWHDLPDNQLRDEERDAWLVSQGYRVLRFTNQQVLGRIEDVLALITGSLPPRWGKGGDGGACTAVSGTSLEAAPPPSLSTSELPAPPPNPPPSRGRAFDGYEL